jgi:hypothetical protein
MRTGHRSDSVCRQVNSDPCLHLQSDYEAANFDVKKAKGYWQLGRLGLEETQELQAKVRGLAETGQPAASSVPCSCMSAELAVCGHSWHFCAPARH